MWTPAAQTDLGEDCWESVFKKLSNWTFTVSPSASCGALSFSESLLYSTESSGPLNVSVQPKWFRLAAADVHFCPALMAKRWDTPLKAHSRNNWKLLKLIFFLCRKCVTTGAALSSGKIISRRKLNQTIINPKIGLSTSFLFFDYPQTWGNHNYLLLHVFSLYVLGIFLSCLELYIFWIVKEIIF